MHKTVGAVIVGLGSLVALFVVLPDGGEEAMMNIEVGVEESVGGESVGGDSVEIEEVVEIGEALQIDYAKQATHFPDISKDVEAYWTRSWAFFWNNVEPTEGNLDFEYTDEAVIGAGEDGNFVLPVIMPYANWDQDKCHGEDDLVHFSSEKGGSVKVGKPCDLDAYANFLGALVERYDGDGIDDMPGLAVPIKHWEIMNEPELQDDPYDNNEFFHGTAQDYFEILKASYTSIKAADPQAQVLHAGIVGPCFEGLDFWRDVYSLGAADYFDIANIHTSDIVLLYEFREYLKAQGLGDRLIWASEFEFGLIDEYPDDFDEYRENFAKNIAYFLAHGVDKIFVIPNWMHWGGKEDKTFSVEVELISMAFTTVVNKLNFSTEVEILYEEGFQPGENDTGYIPAAQYKFSYGEEVLYVLWGDYELPSEIQGEIVVTDIFGESSRIMAEELVLGADPVFVEVLWD